MAKAVTIQNLSVVLAHNFVAIDDLSLDINPGSITGIIGPSGAGKTTLIRAIVGRQRVTNGQIEIFGELAGSARLRHEINYMTQAASVYPDLSVHQNLQYFAAMVGSDAKEDSPSIAEILETVHLTPQTGQLVSSLSGGQKQRVSLAIALIGGPRLMVLDEPTVGLDPVLREQLWQLFEDLAAAGTTIVISSHAMDEAERCGELALIRDGRLLAHGTPAQLMHQTNTKSVESSFIALVNQSTEVPA